MHVCVTRWFWFCMFVTRDGIVYVSLKLVLGLLSYSI